MFEPAEPPAHPKPDARATRERPDRIPKPPPVPPALAALTSIEMTRTKKSARTFTHAHRQRLDRAAEHYLLKCYRTRSAARASEFAMDLGLTPEYVSGLATQILGKSLHDFLREKQVAYAARLLETASPSVTVEEIAIRSGFGTAGTLYRWFVAIHGVTPGEFRGLKK